MASGDSGPSGARRPARRPGRRPLDRAKDQAITAAVVDVLARLGFSGFTMDEVALAAGVGKAAIYRRWASKTDLLASYTEGSIQGTLDAQAAAPGIRLRCELETVVSDHLHAGDRDEVERQAHG